MTMRFYEQGSETGETVEHTALTKETVAPVTASSAHYLLPPRLTAYLNARVTVHYASGYSDTGVVTHLDPTFVELLKDTSERLLIPLMGVRLLKLLDGPKPEGEAGILLRPAEGERK